MKNNKKRFTINRSLLLIVLVGTMILICEEVFARAGGGGRYSGGSGSSGGGSGGAIAKLIELVIRLIWETLMWLCREYPAIGYPLTIIFIIIILWLVWLGIKSEKEERDSLNIDPFEDSSSSSSKSINNIFNGIDSASNAGFGVDLDNSALRTLKQNDPDFNEKVFCARAKKAFNLIQKAWSKRDLSNVEAFLGDGTYEQFLIQLGIMKEDHIIDVMEKLQISDASILGYESDNNIDSIFLSITASGVNYFVDERTNKLVEGNKNEKTFTEIWTFIRRTGAKTHGNPGLIEGYCPNCGNKISIGRHTNCSSCGCLLRSGEHDWILTNITQECEWTRRNNNLIPGVRKYIAFDPGFNVQHIEDLTSMMFWRKISSDRNKDIASFRKIATDKYCDTVKKQYTSDKDYKFYDDCSVGSVKIIAVDTDKNDKEDYIYVEVAWDGIARTKKDKEKNLLNSFKKMFEKRKLMRNVFVLKRKRGVMTDTRTGLCAAPCPCCGAMENQSSNNECEYCGAVMNDGNRDWVVDNILAVDDSSIDSAISRVKRNINKPIKFEGYNKPNYKNNPVKEPEPNTNTNTNSNTANIVSNNPLASGIASAAVGGVVGASLANNNDNATPEDQLKWLIGMMLVDGSVNKYEFGIVCEYAIKIGLNEDVLSALVKSIMAESRPMDYLINNVPIPRSDEFMQILIRVVFADGIIAKEELNLLRYISKRINYPEVKLKQLFEEEKARFNQQRQQ